MIVKNLESILKKIAFKQECQIVEFNGERDHVHLILKCPPKVSISKAVNSLKGASSRVLRSRKYPEIKSKLWGKHFWSPSYFVSSIGGVTIEEIRKYVENQERPISLP